MRISCQQVSGAGVPRAPPGRFKAVRVVLGWCVTACIGRLQRVRKDVYSAYTLKGNTMKTMLRAAGLTALLLTAGLASAGTATVTYGPLDKMTDVPRFASDREGMEAHFREHMGKLAEQLPAGQVLKVEFVDIDLAGDQFPRVAIQDVRVLKGRADWPRMELRWSVEQDGTVVSSGTSKVADPNYLMSSNRYNNEMYGYEKEMLDDWFRKEVLKKKR
ncbi:DUF3016 domain-containing protein [Pseudoduganella flava]|uniref:DUF3016 domain-containing protein n=2 Tax=Pseudoduganella flava TaxID=871742 RepID=A0ABX6FSD0_9BURK|nr:DUF3016 domain-containing protein [Pseudoduganella flava]